MPIRDLPIATPALAARYEVQGTTLVSTAQRHRVEIGDAKQPDFKPQVKTLAWDNVANLSLRLVTDEEATVTYEGASVVYTTPTMEARLYDLPDVDGGIEFSVRIIDPRRASNVVTFSLQTKGLDLLVQPPLRHEQPDGSREETNPWGGTRRQPAHIVGSVAVYATGLSGDYTALGGHNYQAGKIGHIFRPWAENSRRRVWCDLAIDEASGLLTITVPQDLLDDGESVLVDPTFGYTTHGGSTDDSGNNLTNVWAKAFQTPAASGTLDSITYYGNNVGGGVTFDTAIYSNLVTVPNARLAFVTTGAGTAVGTIAEYTTPLTYGSLTSGVQYWLGLRTGSGTIAWRFDAGTNELAFRSGTSNWDDPAGTVTLDNQRITIWGTYTSAGDVVITPTVAALTLTGGTPGLFREFLVVPTAGALTLTGGLPAPVLSGAVVATPTAGALTLSGGTIVVQSGLQITPSVGSLTWSGGTPGVGFKGPDSGTLTLSGGTPTVFRGTLSEPAVGNLTLTGGLSSPIQGQFSTPTAGSLTLTGGTPDIGAGQSPTPTAGSLTLVGGTVTLFTEWNAMPSSGSLSFVGGVPVAQVLGPFVPTSGSLTWTGGRPHAIDSGNVGTGVPGGLLRYLYRLPDHPEG